MFSIFPEGPDQTTGARKPRLRFEPGTGIRVEVRGSSGVVCLQFDLRYRILLRSISKIDITEFESPFGILPIGFAFKYSYVEYHPPPPRGQIAGHPDPGWFRMNTQLEVLPPFKPFSLLHKGRGAK